MEHQIFDVDLVLANQVFGSGKIITEEKSVAFSHLKISKPLFKENANDWLFQQLQKGVPWEGVFCEETLVSQLVCTIGSRVLTLTLLPEKLVVTFDVNPV